MNTKILYMYRDGGNYKQFDDVTVSGAIKFDDIKDYLEDDEYFIPSQVGLYDLQPADWDDEIDHVWHEINIQDFKQTEERADINITAEQLIYNFKNVSWDIEKALFEHCYDKEQVKI